MENKDLTPGFTLIELLMSIAIASVIAMVVYFGLDTALTIWQYSSKQLELQKVTSESIDKLISGGADGFGLRHSLEFVKAGTHYVEFVPPWIDDTHRVEGIVYVLNRRIKPGTPDPLGDFKVSGEKEYEFVNVIKVDSGNDGLSRVKLPYNIPIGSALRFIYYPNAKANPDVIKTIWWDSESGHIYSDYCGQVDKISENPFGVKVTDMEFRYYDKNNNLIRKSGWLSKEELNLITGVEISMEVELNDAKFNLVDFVNIPNAPLHSGFFCLKEGAKIPIPDSLNIFTLLLKNFSGVEDGDILQLDAVPDSGKSWRIKIVFKRLNLPRPGIGSYTIEYPIGHIVYTEHLSRNIDRGLNLLTVGPNGLYDYDDDEDIEDLIILKGNVKLKVTEMDIEGAGLFVRP